MESLVSAFIRGFPIGCVYALIAIGFVLAYKTSGVFNLAFGAQAYASAAVYFVLRERHDWPIWASFIIAVVLLGPALGWMLDRLLYRHLRTAPDVAKLVASLGLLIALPAIVSLLLNLGSSPSYGPTGIVYNGDVAYRFSSYAVSRDEIATIVVTFFAVAGLTALFRFTPIGLRMRAVVESPRMTELAGVNADRVGSFAWMLSSFFAGLAGVLLAPLFPQVSAENFFLLIVAAIAVAVFASLSSLPMALLGGLLLGVLGQLLSTELPTNSVLSQGLRPSLPFVALFLLLVLRSSTRTRREVSDPLSGVDPPTRGLALAEPRRALVSAKWIVGAVAGIAFVWWALVGADTYWLSLATQAVILGLIFLSITVITGMAGQVSLCQATFAAIGALATAQLSNNLGIPVLVAMLIGALIAGAVGVLLSLPVLRLGGIFLALATLAFAMFFESVMVKFSWVGGGDTPQKVFRPLVGSVDFTSDKSFFVLVVAIFLLVGIVVVLVRNGTTGRALDALRSSEVAAGAIGIDPARARVTAFALSAGIAGLGGGLLAMQEKFANYQTDFSVFLGLFWVVIVVSISARTVVGALLAGLAIKLFPQLVLEDWLHLSVSWQFILFGLGAVAYAKHPEGTLEWANNRIVEAVERLFDRRARGAPATAGASPPLTPAAPDRS